MEVSAGRPEVETGDDPAQVGIVQGRLLAQKIRQGEQGTRFAGAGLAVEGLQCDVAEELLLPAQERPTRGHAPIGQPLPREGVGVEVETVVEEEVVTHRQNVPGPAELDERVTVVQQACAEGAEYMVRATNHNDRANGESRLSGGRRRHRADDGPRVADRQ